MKYLTLIFVFVSVIYSNSYSNLHFIDPEEIKAFVDWECKKYKSTNVIWENIAAIISIESSFATNAISKDKCRGLMGISPILIKEYNFRGTRKRIKHYEPYITEETVFIVKYNLVIGIWYFSLCLSRASGDIERALTLYFWGINSKRIKSFYSAKVLKRKEILFK